MSINEQEWHEKTENLEKSSTKSDNSYKKLKNKKTFRDFKISKLQGKKTLESPIKIRNK